MIRFADRQVSKILSGEKTFTRINVECPWMPDQEIIAVHTSGEEDKPFACLKVISINKHKLGDITDDDVLKEGYSSREEFFEAWRNLHGSADPREVVCAIEFDLVRSLEEDDIVPLV